MAFLPAASISEKERRARAAGAPIATGSMDIEQIKKDAPSVRQAIAAQDEIPLNVTPLEEPAGAPAGAPAGLGAPEEYVAGTTIREGQTPEGFTRRIENVRGGFGEITTAQPRTTDTPEQVEAALAGVQERSDVRVQNIIRQQEQAEAARAPTIASQIQELEAQLETPGRGLRQSFGELLTETQGRRNTRKRLDELYAQQKTETTEAGQTLRAGATATRTQQNADRNYKLALARFEQTGSIADQASRRRAFEDARKVHTSFAKDAYDDPVKQQAYVAKQLSLNDPQFLSTPEGLGYIRSTKKELVKAIRSERGLIDWVRKKFGGDEAPSQSDIESLSFKGWKIGDEGPWISFGGVFGESKIVGKKGKSGNYAYLDNLSVEQVWVMEQLIMRDNPEDYPNAKREDIRTGQR